MTDQKTFFSKLKRGLFMTHTEIIEKVKESLTPDLPISKEGIDLTVKQGLAVGEPARSIGLDAKDMGKAMNWKAERIDKLVSATDF